MLRSKPFPASQAGGRRPGLDQHPIPLGFPSSVVCFDLLLGPFIEGKRFVARAPIPGLADFYLGSFDGDPRTYKRFVFPEFQSDPDRIVRILRELWLDSMLPEVPAEFDGWPQRRMIGR